MEDVKFDSPAAAFGSNNTCAARQSAHQVLRDHADRLRRDAGRMHQEADRLEQLAGYATGIQGQAEEALWRLAINGISNATPRPY